MIFYPSHHDNTQILLMSFIQLIKPVLTRLFEIVPVASYVEYISYLKDAETANEKCIEIPKLGNFCVTLPCALWCTRQPDSKYYISSEDAILARAGEYSGRSPGARPTGAAAGGWR